MFSRKKILISIIIILAVGAGYMLWGSNSDASLSTSQASTFNAAKRDLTVTVVENGTIESVGSFVIKSAVEGSTTIISIVPEGEVITQEDIDNKRVLVELDSSSLRERVSQQEITYSNVKASFTEATEALDIQKNQNDSDLKSAELSVEFALMDLQKYFGEVLAKEVVSDVSYETDIDKIIKLIHNENIAGEALQTIREMQSNIDLRREELERAKDDLVWTERLVEKEYVAGSDLRADQLKVKRAGVEIERAETSLHLFEQYEFAKQARKLISDYREAKNELQRAEARARSRLAQAEAKLANQQATYNLQKDRLQQLQDQVQACVIYATVPGMVVYASDSNRWGASRTNIEEGASVRERQEIITIPDPSRMAAKIKVHESVIDKVKLGQVANITIDAMRDQAFKGRVSKIAPLPDPQGFLSNPDMKVYSTDVAIEGQFEDIRPGMSAKVEIIVRQLNDIIAVPVQCVVTRNGRKLSYVKRGGNVEAVEVVTGSSNDSFVQIIKGIEQGDEVLLTPPKLYDFDGEKDKSETKKPADKPEEESSEDSPSKPQRAGKDQSRAQRRSADVAE